MRDLIVELAILLVATWFGRKPCLAPRDKRIQP